MSVDRIGRYRLLESIGTGGMAHVYKAVETLPSGVERLVALKCLLPKLALELETRAAFRREARIASALDHPSIVEVYECDCADDVEYIAMEYVPGRTVRDIVRRIRRRNRPPVHAVLNIIGQLCDALKYAHAQLGLIHRDITPSNIIITPNGTAKLIDFGIAKGNEEHATYSGRIKGKAAYMAPETVLGLELDERTDLFSLGVVAFELLTGRSLFGRARDRATALARILHQPLPRSTAINPLIPPSVEHVVDYALQRNRSRRWQSAAEMGAAIDDAAGQLFEPATRTAVADYLSALYGCDGSDPMATQPVARIATRKAVVRRRRATTEPVRVRFKRRAESATLLLTPTG